MPLRDFVCQKCGSKQERYFNTLTDKIARVHDVPLKCLQSGCNGRLSLVERSNEGEGRVAHIVVK